MGRIRCEQFGPRDRTIGPHLLDGSHLCLCGPVFYYKIFLQFRNNIFLKVDKNNILNMVNNMKKPLILKMYNTKKKCSINWRLNIYHSIKREKYWQRKKPMRLKEGKKFCQINIFNAIFYFINIKIFLIMTIIYSRWGQGREWVPPCLVFEFL